MSIGGGRFPSSVDVDVSMSTALSPVQLVSLQFTGLHLIMHLDYWTNRLSDYRPKTIGLMPGFHHSVAVLPLPLRKFRKNYVSAVRITLPT